jgi:hypothetical protein
VDQVHNAGSGSGAAASEESGAPSALGQECKLSEEDAKLLKDAERIDGAPLAHGRTPGAEATGYFRARAILWALTNCDVFAAGLLTRLACYFLDGGPQLLK